MRKLPIILFILFFTLQLNVHATDVDTSWKTKYEAALGFAQTSFTHWAAGGENALAFNGMFNAYKIYNKGKVSWTNYLGLAYGLNIQESKPKVRKTNDKINFLSKGGIYAWKNWDYAGLFEFKSQFADGYNYPNDSVPISKFMAPGYFQLSLGLNYKPVPYFAIFLSPIGARLTVVNDPVLTNARDDKGNLIGAYGVVGENTTLWQVGGSLNAVFKKDILKNINLTSKLDLFSDYLHNPQNIIVNWENNLMMKVNKYISVNIFTMLIYDDLINYVDKEGASHGPRTQFRETLSVGFAYTLEHN
jgi:hypothetical protein